MLYSFNFLHFFFQYPHPNSTPSLLQLSFRCSNTIFFFQLFQLSRLEKMLPQSLISRLLHLRKLPSRLKLHLFRKRKLIHLRKLPTRLKLHLLKRKLMHLRKLPSRLKLSHLQTLIFIFFSDYLLHLPDFWKNLNCTIVHSTTLAPLCLNNPTSLVS